MDIKGLITRNLNLDYDWLAPLLEDDNAVLNLEDFIKETYSGIKCCKKNEGDPLYEIENKTRYKGIYYKAKTFLKGPDFSGNLSFYRDLVWYKSLNKVFFPLYSAKGIQSGLMLENIEEEKFEGEILQLYLLYIFTVFSAIRRRSSYTFEIIQIFVERTEYGKGFRETGAFILDSLGENLLSLLFIPIAYFLQLFIPSIPSSINDFYIKGLTPLRFSKNNFLQSIKKSDILRRARGVVFSSLINL